MIGYFILVFAVLVGAYRLGWRDCANQLRGRNPKGPRI